MKVPSSYPPTPTVLVERAFAIGGYVLLAVGGLVLAVFSAYPATALLGFLPAGGFLLGFGGFFLYVGKEARKDRRRLLDSVELPK